MIARLRPLDRLRPLARFTRRLRGDRSGLALIEFAYTLPIVAGIGLYSLELANYALTNMKVSQITLNLADNASRVGTNANNLPTTQLHELDMNDVLQAARYQGAGIKLTTYGRITVSSLENVKQTYDSARVQRIHWQRCLGVKSGTGYDSSYGTTTTTAGTTATSANAGTTQAGGMGDSGSMVNAPPDSGLMFVEVNYDYHPMVSRYFIGTTKMHYIASFIVRDNRDFSMIYSSTTLSPKSSSAVAVTPSTCDLHAS